LRTQTHRITQRHCSTPFVMIGFRLQDETVFFESDPGFSQSYPPGQQAANVDCEFLGLAGMTAHFHIVNEAGQEQADTSAMINVFDFDLPVRNCTRVLISILQ
jgi:hypothetical protein